MEFKIFENYEAMSLASADEITEDLKKNPAQLLCIAAGYTSTGVLRELVRRYQQGEIDFSKASFVAMDEWADMDADTEGSCGWFLVEEFLSKVNYPGEQVFLWNGKVGDYAAECARAVRFIREHSEDNAIDYLILGTGMNGHLALNEPGTGLDTRAHVTRLDEVTAKVGQKYFKEAAPLSRGLTLGLAEFKEAKRSVLLVNGEWKRAILQKIRAASDFQSAIPATALYTFTNGAIYCDREAAGAENAKEFVYDG